MNPTENPGMGKQRYFFDTYAFFEILRGNPNYDKYINSVIVTTIFNIAELNYNLKKQKDKKIADSITEKYKDFIANVKIDDIKKAMDIKIKNKDLSIPDVVGYAVAKRHKVKFLTGDEGFRNFENVEFIK